MGTKKRKNSTKLMRYRDLRFVYFIVKKDDEQIEQKLDRIRMKIDNRRKTELSNSSNNKEASKNGPLSPKLSKKNSKSWESRVNGVGKGKYFLSQIFSPP
jgi:uncharacterized protein YbcC (UPF0753/DUF2309 family)